MFDLKYKKLIIYPFTTLNIILFVVVLIMGLISKWYVSVILLIIQGIFTFIAYRSFREFKVFYDQYILTLSRRLHKSKEQAFNELPIGILLFNNDLEIEWANPFIVSSLKEENIIGKPILNVAEDLVPLIKNEAKTNRIKIENRTYQAFVKPEERVLYLFDDTEHFDLEQKHEAEQLVIGVIYLDNYDEVTQGIPDQSRSHLNGIVSSILNKWANNHGLLIKKLSSDRYIGILNRKILGEIKQDNFNILDQVREETAKEGIPLTLSVGIGVGDIPLQELSSLAQSSLDLALGRGGDQVSIKYSDGKVKFFGGKTNPVEKRTRVRARVISHALKDLILDSDQVFIMGHRLPDMDAIGSSIGILKIAQVNDKRAYIILDPNNTDHGVKRLLSEVKINYPDLWDVFITPEEAMELATRKTLLTVLDTHRPSMTIEERLVQRLENIVVIDHHRRGEEFIQDAILVYMEPYASSTSELVTELLEYQPKHVKMSIIEATALLAGIIVDTKSFTARTGSRTFDAAAYLRSNGADTTLVQKLLKEDKEYFCKKAKLIEKSYEYANGIAIAKAGQAEFYDHVLIAQAADTLLSMNGVYASFVIARRNEEIVSISARSLGDLNVQLIMENLNGGGHLTNAATQVHSTSVEDVERRLLAEIDAYIEGGTTS